MIDSGLWLQFENSENWFVDNLSDFHCRVNYACVGKEHSFGRRRRRRFCCLCLSVASHSLSPLMIRFTSNPVWVSPIGLRYNDVRMDGALIAESDSVETKVQLFTYLFNFRMHDHNLIHWHGLRDMGWWLMSRNPRNGKVAVLCVRSCTGSFKFITYHCTKSRGPSAETDGRRKSYRAFSREQSDFGMLKCLSIFPVEGNFSLLRKIHNFTQSWRFAVG